MRRAAAVEGLARIARAAAAISIFVVASGAGADVAFDGSIGGAPAIVAPTRAAAGFSLDYLVAYDESLPMGARYGERRGPNLFQSLDRLDLGADERVTFQALDPMGLPIVDLERVIARVTSGNGSLIEGVLRSEIPGADLFLLNPAGVEFRGRSGGRLQLDLPAGFTVSTADFLRFDDPSSPSGVVFDALDLTSPTLSTGPIEAYGFLGSNRGEVRFDFSQPELAQGERFQVVAGDVSFTNDTVVRMPGGTVEIAAVGDGAVEVPYDVAGWATRSGPAATFGEVVVDGISSVRTTDVGTSEAQGRVVIRGGRLVVEDARVQAGGDGGAGVLALDVEMADEIDARMDARLQTSGNRDIGLGDGRLSAPVVRIRGAGTFVGIDLTSSSAGTFEVEADEVRLSDGAELGSTALSAQSGGNLRIVAGLLDVQSGGVVSTNVSGAGAPGGQLSIVADEVVVGSGSAIRSNNQVQVASFVFQGGQAGDLEITTGSLRLEPGGRIEALTGSAGDGGDIRIGADTVEIESGAQIRTSTQGDRDAGDITVTATDSISIAGDDPVTPAGIFARTGTAAASGTGAAGDISLEAPRITLMGSAVVSARSFGDGDAGSVRVKAVDELRLTGTAAAAAEISTRASSGVVGGAIDIVESGRIVIEDGAAVTASTSGTAPGGVITIDADSLTIRGERPGVSPDTAAILSDTSSTNSNGGDAGAIDIDLRGDLQVGRGGEIRAQTRGGGDAGTIDIDAGGTVRLSGGGRISAAAIGTSTGEAGDVLIDARRIVVDGGRIETEAANGTADGVGRPIGGNVSLVAGRSVRLVGGALVSASATGSQDAGRITIDAGRRLIARGARITTEATDSTSDAAGGQIDLRARKEIRLVRSTVSTSVRAFVGDEDGGDITIDPSSVVLDDSQVLAQAILGAGGNIRIVTDNLLQSVDSLVDASSSLGVDGTVVVQGPEDEVEGELVTLPSEFLDAARLLGERCAARGDTPGSFVVGGRTGQAESPTRALPASMPLPAALEAGPLSSEPGESVGTRVSSWGVEGLGLSKCGPGRDERGSGGP